MKIIDRYVISELFSPFLLGIIGFVLIMTTDLLFTFIDLIINRGIAPLLIIRLILYKLPAIMVLTFPVSFLFATAIVLGRMARESEMTAIRTSGVSFFRIAMPVLVLSLFVSGAAFFINERVVPHANRVSDGIIRHIMFKQPVDEMKENVFFRDSAGRFFYVRRIDYATKRLDDIMIYDINSGRVPRVITARTANALPDKWVLSKGAVHSFNDDGKLGYIADFAAMDIVLNEDVMTLSQQKTSEHMTSRELDETIIQLKKAGVNTVSLATDFHMKFSVPLTTFVFAFLAIPLSIPSLKAGKSWGFLLSVIVIFTYYVLASVFRSLGRGGIVDPVVAAWFPPMIVSSLGILLIMREGSR